jgi:hypothetical protein
MVCFDIRPASTISENPAEISLSMNAFTARIGTSVVKCLLSPD